MGIFILILKRYLLQWKVQPFKKLVKLLYLTLGHNPSLACPFLLSNREGFSFPSVPRGNWGFSFLFHISNKILVGNKLSNFHSSASCIVRQQFYTFITVLTTTRPVVMLLFLVWSISRIEGIKTVKFITLPPPGPCGRNQKRKKQMSNFPNSSLLPHMEIHICKRMVMMSL